MKNATENVVETKLEEQIVNTKSKENSDDEFDHKKEVTLFSDEDDSTYTSSDSTMFSKEEEEDDESTKGEKIKSKKNKFSSASLSKFSDHKIEEKIKSKSNESFNTKPSNSLVSPHFSKTVTTVETVKVREQISHLTLMSSEVKINHDTTMMPVINVQPSSNATLESESVSDSTSNVYESESHKNSKKDNKKNIESDDDTEHGAV